MSNTIQLTTKILEQVDDGLLTAECVLRSCLTYMSEDQVADMVRAEELLPEIDNEDDNS